MREGQKKKKSNHVLVWIIVLEVLVLAVGLAIVLLSSDDFSNKGKGGSTRRGGAQKDTELSTIAYEEITEAKVNPVPKPDISEELLTVNEWSRPGKKLKSVDYIVIHYLGNPQTTADQNHHYFESLKNNEKDDDNAVSMSANYIVGMEGEIIHCVPDNEIAYASNQANSYSLSIENCHPDDTGKFTKETYDSLVHLVAYLTEEHDLDADHIIRHYDVTEKDCPKYYVENPEAWQQFKDDVMKYREKCRADYEASGQQVKEVKDTELSRFLQDSTEE